MYSLSKVLQQQQQKQQQQQQRRLERRKRQFPREQSSRQLDPLLVKCLKVMGMPQCAGIFVDDQMSFNRFIRMPLDRHEALGDVFVGRYAQLLDRIEALCASAFSVLLLDDGDDGDDDDDDFKPPAPPSASDIDEPQRNSLSLLLRPKCSTRVPDNDYDDDGGGDDAESFVVVDDEDPPVPRHTNAAPLLRRAGNSDNKSPLIPCRDLVNVSLDENSQLLDVCHHRVGECSLFAWGPEKKKKDDHDHHDHDDDEDSQYFIKDTQQM